MDLENDYRHLKIWVNHKPDDGCWYHLFAYMCFSLFHFVSPCHRERIQFPKSVRTMKKTEKAMPLLTPPWDWMPSYITMFQSSPVRIFHTKTHTSNQTHFITDVLCWMSHEGVGHFYKNSAFFSLVLTWNTVIIAAGKVSKLVGGVPFSKLNLRGKNGKAIRKKKTTMAKKTRLDLQVKNTRKSVNQREPISQTNEIEMRKQHWLSPEELHAQQGKDNYEEKEQEEQADDGLHGVQQRDHKVSQRSPVPARQRQELSFFF